MFNNRAYPYPLTNPQECIQSTHLTRRLHYTVRGESRYSAKKELCYRLKLITKMRKINLCNVSHQILDVGKEYIVSLFSKWYWGN